MKYSSRFALVLFAALGFAASGAVNDGGAPSSQIRAPRTPSRGLLYYAKSAYALDTRPIANPHIQGAFFQIIWSEIEKEKGLCDWSAVDSWIRPWT